MIEKESFLTIEKPANAEFKDRGSKFIAYAFPINSVEDFKLQLQFLKKEHPKAVHHCFAYRIGIDGNSFRASDDGEPSGTGGKPILGQIDSKGLTDTAVVVVRYWGGSLLGVPGLINAYKSSAALALQLSPITEKQVVVHYSLDFDYTQMNDIMLILKQYNCTIINTETQLFCRIKAGIPIKRNEEILYKLNDLPNVGVRKI